MASNVESMDETSTANLLLVLEVLNLESSRDCLVQGIVSRSEVASDLALIETSSKVQDLKN